MNREHAFWWHFVPHRKLTLLYLSMGLRSFALSMVALFIPLYLYQEMGYTLTETLLFYALFALVFAIFTPIAAKFCARFGIKHSILFSKPFYVVFLGLLYVLPYISVPLLILGLLVGIYLAFYWMGMNLLFHKLSHHNHRGEEVGKWQASKIFATMIGPLLGGVLISYLGFQFVFALASFLFILSALLLFIHKEAHVRYHFAFTQLTNKDHWKDSLFFISKGAEVVANLVIWPLFIFGILGSYVSLGTVGSILAGVTGVLVLFVGKKSDRIGKRRILQGVAFFDSVAWFLRALVQTVGHVFGVSIFAAITGGIRLAPLSALQFDKAQGDITAYFVTREVYMCLGRILMSLIVIMLDSLAGGLVFQGFANLAVLLF
ncbi:hypothetical protein CL620_02960 [archaeon]|nr:hypothetical protein [archaeon]